MRSSVWLLLPGLFLFSCLSLWAQPWDSLALSSLSEFQSPASNWRIVGTSAGLPLADQLSFSNGTGVLANRERSGQGADILTQLEHGDLDLELEFMLPAGGNSGIYLQGRYEIQLFDSWGKARATAGDCGGIYERYDEAAGYGYEGYPPIINAAKAPGLWQHLSVSFRAPRFDNYGNKTENAQMLLVKLNGVVIHESLVLHGPTRGGFAQEVARGPLRIQGDHGPVAIRNLRYRSYFRSPLKWESLRYEVADMQEQFDFEFPATITSSGELEVIDAKVVQQNEKLALRFTGILDLPVDGVYSFEVDVIWNSNFSIDGVTYLTPRASNGVVDVRLSAGRHEIELTYFKWPPWYERKLALYLTGPNLARQALHNSATLPFGSLGVPNYIEFDREVVINRSYVQYGEAPNTRAISHAINVGFPSGVAYTYDPLTASLLQGWRARFLDATGMWGGRGDGTVEPRGAITRIDDLPPIIGGGELELRPQGYRLDENGAPSFEASIGDLSFKDQFRDRSQAKGLERTISWTGSLPAGSSWRIASGRQIEKIDRNMYRVDDRYFIQLNNGLKAEMVSLDGQMHLLAEATDELQISYEIIW